jgi:hypothetical protein
MWWSPMMAVFVLPLFKDVKEKEDCCFALLATLLGEGGDWCDFEGFVEVVVVVWWL